MQRDRVNCGFRHDDKAYVDHIDRVKKNFEDVKKYDDRKEG